MGRTTKKYVMKNGESITLPVHNYNIGTFCKFCPDGQCLSKIVRSNEKYGKTVNLNKSRLTGKKTNKKIVCIVN